MYRSTWWCVGCAWCIHTSQSIDLHTTWTSLQVMMWRICVIYRYFPTHWSVRYIGQADHDMFDVRNVGIGTGIEIGIGIISTSIETGLWRLRCFARTQSILPLQSYWLASVLLCCDDWILIGNEIMWKQHGLDFLWRWDHVKHQQQLMDQAGYIAPPSLTCCLA